MSKFVALILFLILFTSNVLINVENEGATAGVNIQMQANSVEAYIEPTIPCHSSAKVNLFYSYVDCSRCFSRDGRRGIGSEGKCKP